MQKLDVCRSRVNDNDDCDWINKLEDTALTGLSHSGDVDSTGSGSLDYGLIIKYGVLRDGKYAILRSSLTQEELGWGEYFKLHSIEHGNGALSIKIGSANRRFLEGKSKGNRSFDGQSPVSGSRHRAHPTDQDADTEQGHSPGPQVRD